jgi:hypothetical protein
MVGLQAPEIHLGGFRLQQAVARQCRPAAHAWDCCSAAFQGGFPLPSFVTHGADCWVMTADRLLSQER